MYGLSFTFFAYRLIHRINPFFLLSINVKHCRQDNFHHRSMHMSLSVYVRSKQKINEERCVCWKNESLIFDIINIEMWQFVYVQLISDRNLLSASLCRGNSVNIRWCIWFIHWISSFYTFEKQSSFEAESEPKGNVYRYHFVVFLLYVFDRFHLLFVFSIDLNSFVERFQFTQQSDRNWVVVLFINRCFYFRVWIDRLPIPSRKEWTNHFFLNLSFSNKQNTFIDMNNSSFTMLTLE